MRSGCTEAGVALGLCLLAGCLGSRVQSGAGVDGGTDGRAAAPPVLDGRPLELRASEDREDAVVLQWRSPVAPDGSLPDGFVVMREGAVLAEVSADARRFEDGLAETGLLQAPTGLRASDATRADGVELRWEAAAGEPGAAYDYEVHALYGGKLGPAAGPVRGRRAAPVVLDYEVCTEPCTEQAWRSVGSDTHALDTEAPRCTLTAGRATARAQLAGEGAVTLADEESSLTSAPEASYRVRARSAAGPGPASHADRGVRAPGFLQHQWQRSSDGPGGPYEDLPGVTGHAWFDRGPPPDSVLHYRARVSSACADDSDFTVPARAHSAPLLQAWVDGSVQCGLRRNGELYCAGGAPEGAPEGVELHGLTSIDSGFLCGLDNGDSLHCWGPSAPEPDDDVAYSIADAGRGGVCAIRVEDGFVDCYPERGESFNQPFPDLPFASVSTYRNSPCGVLTEDGSLWCATTVTVDEPVSRVEGNWYGGCARLADDGRALCWRFGDDFVYSTEPVSDFSLARCGLAADDGQILCWGPAEGTRVPTGTGYLDLEGQCAIGRDGRVRCFSIGESLGLALPPEGTFVETTGTYALDSQGRVHCISGGAHCDAPAGTGFHHLTGGAELSCVLDEANLPVCFGERADEVAPPPRAVAMLDMDASAGDHDVGPWACGIAVADGRLHCWGEVADDLEGASEWSTGLGLEHIAVSLHHLCGLDGEGRLHCLRGVGANLDAPESDNGRYSALCAEEGRTCVLERASGAVSCWGGWSRREGLRRDGAPYAAVVCGRTRVCALRADDGRIECWGASGVSSWTSVGAYSRLASTCAVRASDGHLVCWDHVGSEGNDGLPLVVP